MSRLANEALIAVARTRPKTFAWFFLVWCPTAFLAPGWLISMGEGWL